MSNTTIAYKQTEVGLIPSDWEVRQLGDLLKFGSGKDYKDLGNGEIPVYGTGGIMTYVNDFLYDGDSVGIGRKGTIDKPVFLNGRFWTVDTLFYTHDFNDVIPKFLFYKFLLIKWKEYNEASGVPSLNKNTLEKIKISVPTLEEQTAIATALSDADALISSLEKLIAKKRMIKQGAMQKLLQPKEGWIEIKLTDAVEYIHGKAHEQDIVEDGHYIVVNSKFISTEGSVIKYSNSNFCAARKDDLLTVLSDLPNGKALAKCFYVEENNKYAVNQRVCIWRTKGAIPRFLFYILNRNKYFLSLNDGVSQTHILNYHIEKCKIFIPTNIEEQVEISTILSDMDVEINALETKLEKYKKVKLGMMQNLLTGRIRLK